MFADALSERRAVVCTLAALALSCGEPLTVYLQTPDSGPAPVTADLGAEPLSRSDAALDATADADTPGAEVDGGPGTGDAGPATGRPPPAPPPAEPPEAAQPPPIVGAREVLAGTTVETLAGSHEAGLRDGIGAAARFHNPVNVVVGPDGDLLVADFDNDRIRRVTPAGAVTTLSGTPALFQRPFGLAFDDAGRLFVQTDGDPFGARSYYTATIWRVDAVTGKALGLVADIGRTRGLAALVGGDLMLTDNAWHHVQRLSPDTAELTDLAGSLEGEAGYQDGHGAVVRFFRPYGAARRPNGNVVVADARNHCLREVTPLGAVSTLFGRCGQPGYVDGPAPQALFDFPQDVAIDLAGDIFVSDRGNHCIRIITPDGAVATLAGDGVEGHVDGAGARARFHGQEGLDVTPDGRTLYVADGDLSQQKPSHYLRVIRRGDPQAPP